MAVIRNAAGEPEGTEAISVNALRREGGGAREDISITVTGDNYDIIEKASDELVRRIREIEGVERVSGGLERGKKEIRLRIDGKKAAASGVDIGMIGTALRGAISGTKATSIKAGDEDIDVIVKTDSSQIKNMNDILSCTIPNFAGRNVPIRPFVNTEEGYSYTVLNHKDLKKSLTITGGIDRTKASVAKVNGTIAGIAQELGAEFSGVEFVAGGEFKEMMESFVDLGMAFLAALFLIYIITASLFNSFRQPVIIMAAIPFGFMGVMLTLFFHGEPVSFGVFMGFVALSGVVVNNSILLNDFTNRLIIQGKKKKRGGY